MYSGTLGLLDYYGVSQLSADARNAGEFYFHKKAVMEVVDANGNISYVPNNKPIKSEDAEEYFENLNDISESMIYDNSFIKLREISLSYPVWERDWLKVSVNLFARNILVWSQLKGLDPEASQGNNNMTGAFERFSMPGTSSYGFGVNVKF